MPDSFHHSCERRERLLVYFGRAVAFGSQKLVQRQSGAILDTIFTHVGSELFAVFRVVFAGIETPRICILGVFLAKVSAGAVDVSVVALALLGVDGFLVPSMVLALVLALALSALLA